MKWCKKALLNCSKLSTDDVGNFVNHSLAAPLRVVGKEWHSISLGGCWRPSVVLKVSRWSWGSLSPSNGSSWGNQNCRSERWISFSDQSIRTSVCFLFDSIRQLVHLLPHLSKEIWIFFIWRSRSLAVTPSMTIPFIFQIAFGLVLLLLDS